MTNQKRRPNNSIKPTKLHTDFAAYATERGDGKFCYLVRLIMIHSIEDYIQFNPHTNPGSHIKFYVGLPTSLDSLCDLLQKQIVHPWNGSPQPIDRKYEPRSNQNVEAMLEKLVQLNQAGLVANRTLDERIIASCRENALLFTSILNFQGVPSRVRAGWVKYLSSDKRKFTDHWVSEVWQAEKR